MRIQEIKILSGTLLIQNLIRATNLYDTYAGRIVLVVYAKSKTGSYAAYEFWAGKENFQHLAGVKHPSGQTFFMINVLQE